MLLKSAESIKKERRVALNLKSCSICEEVGIKKERRVALNPKSCSICKEVALNEKSCSKVAEQLMDSLESRTPTYYAQSHIAYVSASR